MFISSMLEISQFDNINHNLTSYIISCLSLPFICLVVSLIPIHYLKFRKNSIEGSKYFEELYEGTKSNSTSRLYIFIFIVRRAITALSLVMFRALNVWIRCISFTSIQLASAIFTIIVKPFDSAKDNIIEILNEAIFLILCIIITICNDESFWFPSLSHVLISIMLANNVIINVIVITEIIVNISIKWKKKKRPTPSLPKDLIRVAPLPEAWLNRKLTTSQSNNLMTSNTKFTDKSLSIKRYSMIF